MIYLYIKTHNKTGLKYLGKTVQNPFTYNGSGKRWTNHIKKHGNDVTTEIVGTYETIDDLRSDSIIISEKHNIVNSEEWANLRPETGDGGDTSLYIDYSKLNRGKGLTYEQRYGAEKAEELKKLRKQKLGTNSSKRKGRTLVELYGLERAEQITKANSEKHKEKRVPHSEERKRNISEAKKGKEYAKEECSICGKMLGINNIKKHMTTHSDTNIQTIF
ncbi:hypothetical protein UFOVP787_14 [uncultured Caudovirales phage]|uniref:Uncharacterized protein n=1 Tax=uncultured Caudovirales phage TaxID=2100421 RepID=A0A6J5NRT8_9CAUD|nr:hypothetical protein UFOVP787_14 [uncultured Caudovirales phage]